MIGKAYLPMRSQAMWAYGGKRIPTTWEQPIPPAYPMGEYDPQALDITPREDPLWSSTWKIGAAGAPGRVVPYGPAGMSLSGCSGLCGCGGCGMGAADGLLDNPWVQGLGAAAVAFFALKLLRG